MNFGHNCLISEPIFKLFVALFRTHELQKDDMVIFFLWCFRKVRFRKMQFLKVGVQTVVVKAFRFLISFNVFYTPSVFEKQYFFLTMSFAVNEFKFSFISV